MKSDYSEDSLVDVFKGQDAVVTALGAAGLAEETKMIDASVKAGVKRFIPSEFGSNSQNAKATALVPFFGLKVQINEHLKAQESKGLTWTAIEAGPAFDWVSGTTSGEAVAWQILKLIMLNQSTLGYANGARWLQHQHQESFDPEWR